MCNFLIVADISNEYIIIKSVDNEYLQVYNRIKSSKGELTMFRYCFNVVDNKSGNPMQRHGVGLTLSYSFLG